MNHPHTLHKDLAGNNALLASLGFDFVLQELIEIIREGLKRDGLVRLHQFGTFRLRYSKPRQYRHPKTGLTRMLPVAPRVTFKPAKHLRDQIQKKSTPTVIPSIQPGTDLSVATELENLPPEKQEKKERKIKNLPLLAITAVGLLAAIPFILSVLQDDLQAPTENITQTPATRIVASALPVNELQQTRTIVPDIIIPDAATNTIEAELNNTTQYKAQNSTSNTHNIIENKTTDSDSFFLRPIVHKVSKGESLWRLAAKHYSEPLYWPYIYRANKRILSNPDKIDINMKLVIPGLQHPPGNLSKRDQEAIAKGYYLLYEYHAQQGNQQAKDFLIGARRFDANIVVKRMETTG